VIHSTGSSFPSVFSVKNRSENRQQLMESKLKKNNNKFVLFFMFLSLEWISNVNIRKFTNRPKGTIKPPPIATKMT